MAAQTALELVEEIRPENSNHKVEVRRRSDGTLQVVLLKWVDEYVPDYGRVASFWEEVHEPVTIVDSVEAARLVATEWFHNHS